MAAVSAAQSAWVRDTITQHLTVGGKPITQAQPLAVSRCDLERLKPDFLVCEKTDGVWRRFFTAGGSSDGWWSVDRTGCVRPESTTPTSAPGTTIIDCEVLSEGRVRAFDALWIAGQDVRARRTLERLAMIEQHTPITPKRMRPAGELDALLQEIDRSDAQMWRLLPGGDPVDGLIFTPKTGYGGGTLKWKFNHTIDLKVDGNGDALCGGPDGTLLRTGIRCNAPAGVHEFEMRHTGQWYPTKERQDKRTPNYIKVVVHTLEIMAQKIDLSTLQQACDTSS